MLDNSSELLTTCWQPQALLVGVFAWARHAPAGARTAAGDGVGCLRQNDREPEPMPVATATAALRPDLMLRLGTLALRDARLALADAIAGQSAAEAALTQAARALALRQGQAMRSTTDEDVEAFACWLPAGRRAVREAATRATAAAAATAGARAALSLARAVLAQAESRHPGPRPAALAPGCSPLARDR